MTDVLSELSNALAATIDSAGPGIVRVDARRRLPATGIVWSDDGIVVTTHHVVRRDENIRVGLADGEEVSASLIGRDPTTDVAILQVKAQGLAPFVESNKKELAVGHLALALGRPGKTVQATLGIVSALGDSWRTRMGGQIDRYVQTDVVMYPGFSGGPLLDANGHLIGMNSSAVIPGISLAIPSSTLYRVADAIQAHGRVKSGYLGVSSQQARIPQNLEETLGQKTGLLVVSVEPGSPAENAGLSLGDTIVGLADSAVGSHDNLLALLTSDRVGKAVPVKILRGGQVQTVDVVIGERP
jgi:S1-C subfamily serine protease